MSLHQLLNAESALITQMFQRNRIYARVDPAQSIYKDPTSGFIRYALTLRADQRFDAVERIQRELSAALSNHRRARVTAMPVSDPCFGIEVPYPTPTALHWSPRILDVTPKHSMALGRSYEHGATNEFFAFDDSVHCLVAGITGAGKSVLLQNMLLSLCYATPPDELRIILVDLKNEDMVPFEKLPHVMRFVGNRKDALDAINYVVDEKDKRVANRGYKPYRLVLWVDELAQLADNKEAREGLGDLASIGRSKGIHLVGATQHPTEAGGLGTMLKANFPLRLVGMVANGQSHIATGRPKLHADLLPGRGAFLRIEGPRVVRFQSYMIDAPDLAHGVKLVQERWPMPVETPVIDEPASKPMQAIARPSVSNVLQPVIDEYHVSGSEMRRGFMSAAVTALNGGVLPTGTTFQRLKNQVETYLLTYFGEKDEKIIRFPLRKASSM